MAQEDINIAGIDKAELLMALWEGSRAHGMSFIAQRHPVAAAVYESIRLMREDTGELYFDYFYGHVIKCDISGATLDPRLYDRDNGPGVAAAVVATLNRDGT